MSKNNKFCCICNKGIDKKADYFRVTLFIKGEEKASDYAHRNCWHEKNNLNDKTKMLVEGASKLLERVGIKKEQEFILA